MWPGRSTRTPGRASLGAGATVKRRSIATDLARGEGAARALVPSQLGDANGRAAAVAAARGSGLDPAAAEALERQNGGARAPRARAENLKKLRSGDAVAVVTGQQPGLLLGPLFCAAKAASAIAIARFIEREQGVPCVPIFWIQEEDHDHEEIARHTWLRPSGALREVRPALAAAGPRSSIAHARLGDDIGRTLEALATDTGATPYGDEVLALLARHYAPGRDVAGAFAGALGELFAAHGLLTLRPRETRVARALAPLYERCIDEAEPIEAELRDRARRLEAAGYAAKVPIRDGATLCFVHPGGPAGDRHRLIRAEGGFRTAEKAPTSLSRAELTELARREPLSLSTSALLRPLAQDLLLPTAAYTGGDGELAYAAQLAPLYQRFGRPLPAFAPRLRVRWLDRENRRLLGDLSPDGDCLADDGPLARALVRGGEPEVGIDPEALGARISEALARELGGARPALAALDPGLAKACDRTLADASRNIDKLMAKVTRTALGRLPEARDRLAALRQLVRPGGEDQERVLGWSSAAPRIGPERLITELVGADPLSPEIREIVYDP